MSYGDIVAGNFGWVARVTFYEVDENGDLAVKDVSSYTDFKIIFVSPSGVASEKEAVLNSDGTDGKIRYVTLTGDVDIGGDGEVYGRVLKTGAKITSTPQVFSVGDSPD